MMEPLMIWRLAHPEGSHLQKWDLAPETLKDEPDDPCWVPASGSSFLKLPTHGWRVKPAPCQPGPCSGPCCRSFSSWDEQKSLCHQGLVTRCYRHTNLRGRFHLPDLFPPRDVTPCLLVAHFCSQGDVAGATRGFWKPFRGSITCLKYSCSLKHWLPHLFRAGTLK